jgi:hypothetical protein
MGLRSKMFAGNDRSWDDGARDRRHAIIILKQ